MEKNTTGATIILREFIYMVLMGAKIMHLSPKAMVIEMHSDPERVEEFIELVRNF